MSKEPTAAGRRLLEVLVEDPRGHSTAADAAFELSTTPAAIGRMMTGLSAAGLAYIGRFGDNDEYWPTVAGQAHLTGKGN